MACNESVKLKYFLTNLFSKKGFINSPSLMLDKLFHLTNALKEKCIGANLLSFTFETVLIKLYCS